jgi:formylglycine-generating enzyme required for sulfatase activity
MEYVRGQNLAERLDGGWRPSPDQALALVLELARGVAAVTAKRLCHRDIKPANIMITPSGMLKLMDFGLVGRLGGSETTISTANEAVIGTASYLSPEQGYGMNGDHRSDIYSMGVVLYELTTGRLPFTGANSLSLIYHHIHTVPPLPRSLDSSIPAHLERVIMRCLCKNPAQRYQSVEELIEALESSRSGFPRLLRRHGLPLAGLAILLLALAWAWHAQRERATAMHPDLGATASLPRPGAGSGALAAPPPAPAHPLSILAARPVQPQDRPPPAPGLGAMAMDADGWHAELRLGALLQSFRWCPPGSCTIGSLPGSRDHQADEQLHRVTLRHGFWLAATSTSQAWWSALMGNDPSTVHGPQLPVDHVSRDDCQRFCQQLQRRVPGLQARLPWEAEWEYACRGGRSGGAVSARELYSAVAWINADAPRPVGSGTALVWGLQDLLGNTATWCADTYGPYGDADRTDPHPLGPGDGLARGGSWECTAPDCNSAHRFRRWSDLAARGVGLRVVVESGPAERAER